MKNFLTILFTTILLTGCVSVTKEFRTTAEICAIGGYKEFVPEMDTFMTSGNDDCNGTATHSFSGTHNFVNGNSVYASRCHNRNKIYSRDVNKNIRDVYILRCTKQTCLEKYNNEDCITGDPIKDEKVIIRGIKWLEIIPAAL